MQDPETSAALERRTMLARGGEWASRIGSLEPSDPLLRRGLHVGIGLVVVLGLALAISASIQAFPEIEWRLRPLALGLGLLGFALFMVLSAEVWRRILNALGSSLPPETGARIWFVSGLGRFVPTSVLVPVVRVAMSEREGVPKRICMASVVYEVAMFLTGALLVGAYSLVTWSELDDTWLRFLGLLAPLVAVVALHPAIFHRLADLALERLGREPLPLALSGRQVIGFVSLYTGLFILAGISVYGLALSFHPLGTEDLVTVVGAYAFGTTLGLIAFALPAGIVAREAGLAAGLTAIMPTAPAVAIALLVRMVQIVIEILAVITMLARRQAGREKPATA